jgi:hypothetical protein
MERQYAVCLETLNDISTNLPVPSLLHGKVVRIANSIKGKTLVRYGKTEAWVASVHLRAIEGVCFEVGAHVVYKNQPAIVNDVTWHHKDQQPNYLITQSNRCVSKRLIDSDLRSCEPVKP